MPRRTLLILFLLVAVSLACYRRAERNPYVRYFAQVLEEIDDNYVEPVDDQKLFEGAITGMVDQLDRFSGFIPQHEAGEFQRMVLDQKFGGVGIEVYHDKKLKQFLVQTPIVGTPAYEAGIEAGDRIVAVDGHDTRDIETKEQLDRAVGLLRGEPGQPVTLEVIHPGATEPARYELKRRVIHVDSVLGDTRNPDDTWDYMLPGHDRIAYVRITTTFGERTVDELETVLSALSKQGMRGLILDLRNNPGGLLEAANAVCRLFLAKGDVIVSTRGRDRKIRDEFVAHETGPYPNLPLVVLVNRESASASEIVAAALQDHGRALVAGERSFGKGTVQNVIPIEAGKSVLKLTIATYWRPSGKNIHRLESSKKSDEWGVKPNESCEVKMSNDEFAQWEERRRQRDIIRPKRQPAATEAKSTESNATAPNVAETDGTETDAAGSDVAGPAATDPPATEAQATAPAAAEPKASDNPEAGDPQLEAAVECLEHEIHTESTPKAA